ncbi:MAG: acyl-CoA thioesterase [Ruminococcus sp.]|nr:acyl-CoA thioesterase [Ruminococcus sp.]
MFIYHKIPQYYETDQMGIIHHANYIRWFEEARVAYLEELGFVVMKEVNSPIISPVLSADAKYHKMLRLHDKVEITASLVQYNGFRYTFSYTVKNAETDETCCTGNTVHCFLTPDNKPLRMKRDYPELHEKLRNVLEEDALSETIL